MTRTKISLANRLFTMTGSDGNPILKSIVIRGLYTKDLIDAVFVLKTRSVGSNHS